MNFDEGRLDTRTTNRQNPGISGRREGGTAKGELEGNEVNEGGWPKGMMAGWRVIMAGKRLFGRIGPVKSHSSHVSGRSKK